MTRLPASIDVQQHYAPPSLARHLTQTDPDAAHLALRGTENLGDRVAEMDEIGMVSAVVSIPKLGDERLCRRESIVDLTRRCNDELLDAAASYSGRFAVWLTLPLPYVDESLAEIERLRDECLVRGVIAFAATGERRLDDASIEPVFAAIAGRGLPIMVHPSDGGISLLPIFNDWLLRASIGAMVESSVASLRLILSGMLDRVPDLTLLIPHLGGFLPYLMQRIADQNGTGDAEHDVAHYLKTRCLSDTCSFYPPALELAATTMSVDRIMVGSDFPFRGSLRRAVEDVAQSAFAPDERDGLLIGNAVAHGLGLVAQ